MNSYWVPWAYLHIVLALLSDHGPESCKGFPHVTIKQKPGKQTAVERNNIKVASFSGLFNAV